MLPWDVILVVGFLFGVGVFLLLERHLLCLFFGIAILSNAANLFVLAVSGHPAGKRPPLVDTGGGAHGKDAAQLLVDPLPQALVLTAIVIGSGILLYFIFLLVRLKEEDDSVDMKTVEKELP
jgi:multicomponent Na+:H+ antiporter subunit C